MILKEINFIEYPKILQKIDENRPLVISASGLILRKLYVL
ncbi:hypothetical protein X781_6900 [Mannheimia sp. USDA-ARS-USMARC-1261]|nr:hypothetical protein X781_6900 [Mannheimia sp. USDA-ARS-USMARC-1261]